MHNLEHRTYPSQLLHFFEVVATYRCLVATGRITALPVETTGVQTLRRLILEQK